MTANSRQRIAVGAAQQGVPPKAWGLRRPIGLWLAGAAVVGACAVVYLMYAALSSGSQSQHAGLIVAHALVAATAGGSLVYTLAGGRVRLMLFGYSLYVFLWLGLAPLAEFAEGHFPLGYSPSSLTLSRATLIVVIGHVAFLLSYKYRAKRAHAISPRPEQHQSPPEDVVRRRWWFAAVVSSIVALVVVVGLAPIFGGFGTFFSNRQNIGDIASQVSGSGDVIRATLLSSMSLSSIFAACLIASMPKYLLRTFVRSMSGSLALVLCLASNAVANNPFSQSRSWFTTCFAAVLICFFAGRTRIRAVQKVLAVVAIGTIFLLPLGNQFRYEAKYAKPISLDLINNLATSGDYDSYEQIATGVDYTKSVGYQDGRALLGPVFFWVPRSDWAGKPTDTGVLIGQYAGYAYTNLSAPLWIELYYNGGFLLVIAGFIVVGQMWRRVDDYFRGRPTTYAVISIALLSTYQLALLRGSLLTVTGKGVLICLVPAIGCSIFRLAAVRVAPASQVTIYQSRRITDDGGACWHVAQHDGASTDR